MHVGFIGFGKMGSRMVTKLLHEGHIVVGWNRSQDKILHFIRQLSDSHIEYGANFSHVETIKELVEKLESPRVVWLMLPAGMPTEDALSEVAKHVEAGDVVIDGGNAFYLDTQRRFETFALNQVRFLGIGVSGGIHALENGYPLMVGGDESAYQHVKPLLDSLATSHGGHTYFGTGGAGHFVKMVHNGIEYGMMQAIGEGFGVLDKSPYPLDLVEVARLWQKSTIVSGFLLDRAKDALEKDHELAHIEGVIASSGEGEWTVEQAKKEGVPIENIEQSLDFRRRSQTDSEIAKSFAAKMVAALRHEFGGHPLRQSVSEASEVKKK
ncbi:MAG: hypothetical protein RLZZ455_223 [Candidatus Parcubacteria bacterium]